MKTKSKSSLEVFASEEGWHRLRMGDEASVFYHQDPGGGIRWVRKSYSSSSTKFFNNPKFFGDVGGVVSFPTYRETAKVRYYGNKLAHLLFPQHFPNVHAVVNKSTTSIYFDYVDIGKDRGHITFNEHIYPKRYCECPSCIEHTDKVCTHARGVSSKLAAAGFLVNPLPVNVAFVDGNTPVFMELDVTRTVDLVSMHNTINDVPDARTKGVAVKIMRRLEESVAKLTGVSEIDYSNLKPLPDAKPEIHAEWEKFKRAYRELRGREI
jgi:hypothetical protein